MINKVNKLKKLFLLVLVVGILSACNNSQENINDEKITVSVTTTFLADLVNKIGGEHVKLNSLIQPGIDPHQYQASASDLDKLTEADIIFFNGLHLEAKLGDVLTSLNDKGIKVVNVSDAIDTNSLLKAEDIKDTKATSADNGLYDPHIWFDIDLWKVVSQDVTNQLKTIDPKNAEDYQKAYESYLKELDELAVYVKENIKNIPKESRYLVTAHDAFNYFSRFADIEVYGIQGISTNTEASIKDISTLANFIVKNKVKAIFVESSVSPKLIQSLQEAVKAKGFETEIGGELYSDSTGEKGSETETYIGMYKHNVDTIVNALK